MRSMGPLTSMQKLIDRTVKDETERTLNTKQKRHVTPTQFAEKYPVDGFFLIPEDFTLYSCAKVIPATAISGDYCAQTHGLV